MSLLPDADRILLGPGPSLTAPRVMRAMTAPTLSHLDPQMMRLLDEIRERLARLFSGARAGRSRAADIEIGAGLGPLAGKSLGPLAGKIWRVGLMGASSSPRLVMLLCGALESVLARQGHRVPA